MEIKLKKKYRTYTESAQYSNGRKHNGNGRRADKVMRQHSIQSVQPDNKPVKFMDGLTGKSKMV